MTECGQSSKENITLWTSSGSNFNQQQTCSVMINKINSDICQFRVDFFNFAIQQPTNGDCNMDRFTVSGQDYNSIVPTLCGTNTGQHCMSIYQHIHQFRYQFRWWVTRSCSIRVTKVFKNSKLENFSLSVCLGSKCTGTPSDLSIQPGLLLEYPYL